MFVFRKIWRALFSWNTRFEIRPFALLPTFRQYQKNIAFSILYFFSSVASPTNVQIFISFLFSCFFKNTNTAQKVSKCGVFLAVFFRIQSESGKIRTRKTPYLDTFHAMKALYKQMAQADSPKEASTVIKMNGWSLLSLQINDTLL